MSFVENNPVRYTDPTGHEALGDSQQSRGCTNPEYCENGKPKTYCTDGSAINAYAEGACIYPEPPEDPGYSWNAAHSSTKEDKAGEIAFFAQFMKLMLDALKEAGEATEFIRKSFILGRAVNPHPGWDFAIGVVGQALSDASEPMPLLIRGERVFVVGVESLITGVASDAAGALGFLVGEAIVFEGGGIVGAPIFLVGSSLYLDYKFWPDYNHQYLGAIGF